MTDTITYTGPERCYCGLSSGGEDDNPAATGGIEYAERRADGCERWVGVNGCHVQHGPWQPLIRHFAGRHGSGSGYYVWIGACTGHPIRATTAWHDGEQWVQGGSVAVEHIPSAALEMLANQA